ncbi:unnamed protein product [Heterobilharzia americana]|nr:unnamed protein product [Heterobilharzia americana]
MYSRRQGVSLNVGYLTADELEAARHKVLCMVQQEVYGELIKELREKGSCETEEGELQRLSPILVDGLVCVGGRLNYSDYPLTFKHPVILPRHHFVTELIIRHYHIIEGHTGTSQVLATLRRNYWIIKGISAVKRVIRKCIECRRLKAALGQQMMAPLPVCRVQKGWKQVNYLADVFWRRWMKEYLPCLQTRQKWLGRKRNFKEGDVVIVASEKTPRGSWPLGVIETCEKDEDDLVRTVMVRMKEGTVRRDIRKLCLLEGVEER